MEIVLWELEEAVVLFDLYLQNGTNVPNKQLEELSKMYQNRAKKLSLRIDEKYRNLAGLRMQLACMEYVVTGGERGLSAASKLFSETYELYQSDPVRFKQIKEEFYQKYKEPCKAMKAIVTVIGKDRVGITAAVCSLLARHNINILDITQTVLQEFFTMVMLVDTSACEKSVGELTDILSQAGEREGLSIRIQREDIFNAMHRI